MMPKSFLKKDARVQIFRHGHAEPIDPLVVNSDFVRPLSEKGRAQAEQLGKHLASDGTAFDTIICSAAPRVQENARLVTKYLTMREDVIWYNGKEHELFGPAKPEDDAAYIALATEIGAAFARGEVHSAASYGLFRTRDYTGFLDHFIDESRAVVFGVPHIEQAQHIAIFSHALLCNAIAEALFPQHAATLGDIELAPCDSIILSTTQCEYIPFIQ